MKCHICDSPRKPFAQATILEKHLIQYFQCSNCRFVQTEEPYWLDEAYTHAINDSDVGLIGRNYKQSRLAYSLINTQFDAGGKFVDYGGGYGLFVRMMRDKGLRFFRYDPFCENLFAKGFDVSLATKGRFELVTAFEVFEHLAKPLDEIGKMLQFAGNIYFSTILLPPHQPEPDQWWYYGLDHGQHVSIFSRKSLAIMAEKFGLHLTTDGRSNHLLSAKAISPWAFRIALSRRGSQIINFIVRRHSLVKEDYFQVTGRPLN